LERFTKPIGQLMIVVLLAIMTLRLRLDLQELADRRSHEI
jgi:hypothetical protein